MLTKKVFKKQMQKLVNLYPNWKINISDKEVMQDWYEQFKNYEDEVFEERVQDYIDNQNYPPTVAGIKNTNGPDDGVTVV